MWASLRRMASRKLSRSESDKSLASQEQQAKINEVIQLMGPIASKFPAMCSDDSLSRFLRARNWNTKKACKMLKDAIKWRLEYKPDKLRWEDVAEEAKTGKLYVANYHDKYGRTVIVMRPGFENTNSAIDQVKYIVYCVEKAISNLKADQEQIVCLINFQGWSMGCVSMKATRETAHVLQDYYPERLGVGIFYNPPKIFESSWKMIKPFLEPKTYKKVMFVYSDNQQSLKIMDELFEKDKLESFFDGNNSIEFNFEAYSKRMRDEDSRNTGYQPTCTPAMMSELQQPETN